MIDLSRHHSVESASQYNLNHSSCGETSKDDMTDSAVAMPAKSRAVCKNKVAQFENLGELVKIPIFVG